MSIVVIMPYYNRPISTLIRRVEFYAKLDDVTGVQIIEFDTGSSAKAALKVSEKVIVVHKPNDLRFRFCDEHSAPAEFVLVCDDDILPPESVVKEMLSEVRQQSSALVGAWGRGICRRTQRYLSRQAPRGAADIILTKLMICRRQHLQQLSKLISTHGHVFGALALNCEDIVFSLLWSHCIGQTICRSDLAVRVRDELAMLGGLCNRPAHFKQRTDAVRLCLQKLSEADTLRLLNSFGLAVTNGDPFQMKKSTPPATSVARTQVTSRDALRKERFDRRYRRVKTFTKLNCIEYWCARYEQGGMAGAASYGDSAKKRGACVTNVLQRYSVQSLIDLGCGDADQVSHIHVPCYFGVDVSPAAIRRCIRSCKDDASRKFVVDHAVPPEIFADAILLMDVLHCLTDDELFRTVLKSAFCHPSASMVIIVGHDKDLPQQVRHIRHRTFGSVIRDAFPEWQLALKQSPVAFSTQMHVFTRGTHWTRMNDFRRRYSARKIVRACERHIFKERRLARQRRAFEIWARGTVRFAHWRI